VGVILGVCIGGCFAVYLFFSLKKYCRKEKNIEQFLGVALARIHNVDLTLNHSKNVTRKQKIKK
jgi:hypothetical protein